MKPNPFAAQLAEKHPDEIRFIIKFVATMMETQNGGECWSCNPEEFTDKIYAAIENESTDDDPEEVFW